MTQDQPSRLDRIEIALESMQQRMDSMQSRMEQFDRRTEDYFANQAELNAEFRARQEIQSRQIAELRESIVLMNQGNLSLRQNLELQAQNVEALVREFRQHRSDGHGGTGDEQG